MIKIHTWPLCLAFSVALLAAATSAQAQTPAPGTGAKDTSNGAALEEVIVTAERRPEALKDAPVAVTVVNAEQLADQHVYNIAELAQTTPAL
jgi:iron complex outermembrane receptor protein